MKTCVKTWLAPNDQDHEDEDDRRADVRYHHVSPNTQLLGTVDTSRLYEVSRHPVKRCEEHDEGPAHTFPDTDEPNDGVPGPGLSQPVDVHGVSCEKRDDCVGHAPLVGEDIGEDIGDHDPRRDDGNKYQRPPEASTWQAIRQECSGEQSESHLDRHGDNQEQQCIPRRGPDRGVSEDM